MHTDLLGNTKDIAAHPPISMRILYNPGLELFISDQLSRHNHKTDRDQEIPITINAIESRMDILDCKTA